MTSDAVEPQKAYKKALHLLQTHQLPAAIEILEELLTSHALSPLTYRLQGILALKQGKLKLAEKAWLHSLSLDPQDAESLFYLLNLYQQSAPERILSVCKRFLLSVKPSQELYQLAGQLLLSLDPELALQVYTKLWALRPQVDWALALAKKIEKSNQAEALKWYLRAFEQEPENTELLDHLGRLFFQRGQFTQALDFWQKLCQIRPQARVLTNIASVQIQLNQIESAKLNLQHALSLQADLLPANYQMARLSLQMQDFETAIEYLPKIWLKSKHDFAEKTLQIAILLMQNRQYKLADRYFELCCDASLSLPKETHEIYAMRGICALSLIDAEKISQMYQLAQDYAPHPLTYAWPKLIALPYIYQSHEHLATTRLKFEAELDILIQQVETAMQKNEDLVPLLESATPPFLLAYQGCSNRDILQKIGQVFTRVLKAGNHIAYTKHRPESGRKIRVGFISSFFYEHSVSICYGQRILDMASKSDFDVTCIYLYSREDQVTQRFRQEVQNFVQLLGDLSPQQIIDLELDILIYLDIGMEPKTYQLGFHRLAPIQLLVSGHPETSGLPEIDYYFSSFWGESDDAQNYYTETLIKMKENISIHIPVQEPDPVLDRSEIGFESEAHIYFCPMTLFKVHPDFDRALAEILVQDPQGLIYFVQDSQPALAQALQARFQKTLPLHAERIRFLPWMDQQTFYSALLQADVVLDTFHFGGGTTARMVLGLGVPMVCYPGQQFRGRMTYAHYLRLGLEKYVPKNQQEYVHHALRLAKDKAYRLQLQALLRSLKPKLYAQECENQDFEHILRLMVALYPTKITQQQVDHYLEELKSK